MSEPKRYKVGKIGTTEMIDCVSYEDYARLKAEVERLTKENETITKDNVLLWASHKIALQDIQGLHYALQIAKGVQS